MWTYLYGLWRSVLQASASGQPEPMTEGSPSRASLQENLRGLLGERTALQRTAASYEDFGYDDLAGGVREQIRVLEQRIRTARRMLHGPELVWREGLEGPESR